MIHLDSPPQVDIYHNYSGSELKEDELEQEIQAIEKQLAELKTEEKQSMEEAEMKGTEVEGKNKKGIRENIDKPIKPSTNQGKLSGTNTASG